MRNAWVFVSVACLAGATAAYADATQLTGDNLQQQFSGKTIYLSAPFGALPIKYSPGGTMVAKSKALALFSGVERDTGRWWVQGDQFCQKWQTWNGGKSQCFTVLQKGGTMHWTSNDGMTGTAMVAK